MHPLSLLPDVHLTEFCFSLGWYVDGCSRWTLSSTHLAASHLLPTRRSFSPKTPTDVRVGKGPDFVRQRS